MKYIIYESGPQIHKYRPGNFHEFDCLRLVRLRVGQYPFCTEAFILLASLPASKALGDWALNLGKTVLGLLTRRFDGRKLEYV